MNRETFAAWVAEQFGIQQEYPWGDNNAVLRRTDNRKWFAAILEVDRSKLGLEGSGVTTVVNVKSDPRIIGSLLDQPGFHRAYHMNKEKWISIRLDGSVPEEQLQALVSMSYDLTATGKKR